ncbi:hypothetical protein CDL15_Pgr017112 [Punica granatum]|uniref:Uncharacterized protein n=1 Tax=Punica granatum TaxID=22663 RepID=A0A218VYP3_PUNGR|nr:hypothetical protein CDL15_Pgr017112 [Punica granatum]
MPVQQVAAHQQRPMRTLSTGEGRLKRVLIGPKMALNWAPAAMEPSWDLRTQELRDRVPQALLTLWKQWAIAVRICCLKM